MVYLSILERRIAEVLDLVGLIEKKRQIRFRDIPLDLLRNRLEIARGLFTNQR
jgi:hypothetical protein